MRCACPPPFVPKVLAMAALPLSLALGCSNGGDGGPALSSDATSITTSASAGTESDAEGEADNSSESNYLDIMAGDGTTGTGGGCSFDEHTPCDAPGGDPFQAMGLNCPGELSVDGTVTADPLGVGVLDGWGTNSTYAPTEGSSYLVLSTGDLSQRNDVPSDPGDAGFHCNSWFAGGGSTPTTWLPPLNPAATAGDCFVDPTLVGTGDCSGTIEDQFNQSGFKYDYQEARFTVTVPEGANALSFDVAFLTKEYPIWAGRPYNDIFVAWMESPMWSGNMSFDQNGSPLSLNAAFLEHYDDDGTLPEFANTCMRYSAGTGWLNSSIRVNPGDEITLVFAIFDMDDVNWDSFVFLDNVQWSCEEGGGPTTVPID